MTWMVGQRVQVTKAIDRFPDFVAQPGFGRVAYFGGEGGLWVKYEETIPGCEAWENDVYLDAVDLEGVRPVLNRLNKRDRERMTKFGVEFCDVCGLPVWRRLGGACRPCLEWAIKLLRRGR